LTGNLDFAYASITGTQPVSNAKTITTGIGTSSTSVINIDAIEDLGNGLKGKVHYGLDPRTLSNDSLGYTAQAADKATSNTVTGLARDEVYVGLASNYGEIKLGAPNSIGLNTFQAASPLGTGIGSGYAPNSGAFTNAVVTTRYNRSARFDTAAIEGFTASVLYAPGNDVAPDTTANAASLQQANQVVNARKTTELGLKYANGPLNVAFANIKQAKMTNSPGWYANAPGTGAVTEETSSNIFGANYKFQDTTVYFGRNNGDKLTTTSGVAVAAKGTRFAAKQTIGQIDLIAQSSKYATGGVQQKVTGLRADYNFSKTTAAYIGYEKWDTGIAAALAKSTSSGDRKVVSMGLRKSF
jgi:Gram-negative porin